ncbi:hypothetical protein N7539_001245 [Penicillium diatomitis]|uniref:CAP-Gly domain-containing protein n=1 Tax=Penicillium diatomitis TaxID=2819901 RepID=A0A9W9XPS2_9EURO|nr:uncharacterized protein N7539_001245 [Penicillium diatomitis]KAJ5496129.1 hypothetical protein N7539_001245 [Penicillium diatomitis]
MSAITVGHRRSYDGQRCTIRFVGPLKGTTGEWLGVEWDDPTRGKHSGEHKGEQQFTCKSNHPTAGSFVRPSRPSDSPRGFLDALRAKYAAKEDEESTQNSNSRKVGKANQGPIEISGKVVEEVGFDKIGRQFAQLEQLRIALLDGLCVTGILSSYEQPEPEALEVAREIASTCPNIEQLDLSRNLLSSWRHVWHICSQLKGLKKLKVNGDRFQPLEDGLIFQGITELHLADTLMTWDEIVEVISRFPSLTNLVASGNQVNNIAVPVSGIRITTLILENNEFESLSALRPLAELPTLQHLSLRGNNIHTISADPEQAKRSWTFPPSVTSVDLSRNKISSWDFVNQVPLLFPGLTTLRMTTNPLYDQSPLPPAIAAATSSMSASQPMTLDEAFMLTLARFPASLTVLNYSTISAQDRSNAEMYYLSLIGKELSATSESEQPAIVASHPRYKALCELYGEPAVTRTIEGDGSGRKVHPRSVAARLVKLAFRLSDSQTHVQEVPNSFDAYQVKAIVSRLFGLTPFSFRLIWETDEWDPIEQRVGEDGEVTWDDDSDLDDIRPEDPESLARSNRFTRREIELTESTRDIGFLFQGETGEMKIRVDIPSA